MLMGAHAAPHVRPRYKKRITSARINAGFSIIMCLIILSSDAKVAFGAVETEALLKFKSSLENAEPFLANWNPFEEPCAPGRGANWAGLLCTDGKVYGLQLEKMALSGKIDIDSLLPLAFLRSLSFMDNNFEGPLPDFRKLGYVKSLYLSNNKFSGEIPDDAFKGMLSLKKVFMANNNFIGKIPTSLANSPRLLELRIEGNDFDGAIPIFPPDLKFINASHNNLAGPLPKRLQQMDPTLFSGNKDLCGPPLDNECKPSPAPLPAKDKDDTSSSSSQKKKDESPSSNHSQNHSMIKIILIVLAILIAIALHIMCIVICCRRRKKQTPQLGRTVSLTYSGRKMAPGSSSPRVGDSEAARTAAASKAAAVAEQHGRLTFVREDRQRFELQDLLRASAEVLGSGSFGSSYKAALMDGQHIVVKRFKQMNNVGKEEFHEHMRRLGRLRHPNLLPLVAYYYRKEEKLLVFDYVVNGSLASHLHGKRSADQATGLDWPTRLKIIKGAAKGLAYLHSELPSVIVPHGHLKSSNVLLDKNFDSILMDYTLVPVVNMEQAQLLMVAYKSPEFTHRNRTTKKTDVWSLGILILEVLTGKFPAKYLAHGSGYGTDLASWVDSIVGEAGGEVFDRGMGGTKDAQGELLKLLKIGVSCCQEDLEARPDLKEAVEQILTLKGTDHS